MKRIVALIIATLMLAVVSPVVMAADLDFSGELSSQIGYYKIDEDNEALDSYFHGDSTFSISASLGENLKAGFSLTELERLFEGGWVDDTEVSESEQTAANELSFLDSVWLEAKGAIVPGAPEMTTRLGGQDVNYSLYIADDISQPGISVDDIQMGPVSVGAFYVWNQSADREDKGGQIRINPNEQLELKGTVVEADQLYYAVDGKVIPMENVEVSTTYSAREDEETATKADVKLQLTENTEVRAGYRSVTDNFTTNMPYDNEDDIPVENGEDGFSVGATTNQLGFELSGDYTTYDEHDAVEFSVARGFGLAGMNFDTMVEGNYDIEDSEMDELDATVGYNAPNGMGISAGYDFVNEHSTFTAGLSMEF